MWKKYCWKFLFLVKLAWWSAICRSDIVRRILHSDWSILRVHPPSVASSLLVPIIVQKLPRSVTGIFSRLVSHLSRYNQLYWTMYIFEKNDVISARQKQLYELKELRSPVNRMAQCLQTNQQNKTFDTVVRPDSFM